jgi:acetyltransferase EpsM
MLNVHVIGAGGLGREVAEYVVEAGRADGSFRLGGFIDDRADALRGFPGAGRVVGQVDALAPGPDDVFLVAVGDPRARVQLAARALERGARFFTLVHPLARVAPSAVLGDGCVVAPFASVSAWARLGAHVVLDTHASVGHDAEVGEASYLGPHASLGGAARLGPRVFVRGHARVEPRASVAVGAVLAAGAVVDAR